MVDLLNKSIGKDSCYKHLSITFTNNNNGFGNGLSESGTPLAGGSISFGEIKFHKYLKHLKSLSMKNVADKNFSETLFDMASIRKLKDL